MEGGLAGNPGEEAGDELVGELAEAEMDLLLQSCKAGGVLGKLFSPELLLLLQLRADVLEGMLGRWDGLPGLGAKTEEHQAASSILLPLLSFYARGTRLHF